MAKRNNPLCKVGNAVSVDIETGEETPIEDGGAWLMPNAPGTCDWCAVDHPPELPHDKQSLYYQMKFKAIKGRWPTWTDAMEHCTEEVKAVAREAVIDVLTRHGLPIPEDLRQEGSG
jgi:hypothetical protein